MKRFLALLALVATTCILSLIGGSSLPSPLSVSVAHADTPGMICSRIPGLEYVGDSYFPYSYLGLDHYVGFDQFYYVGYAEFGGPGAYLVWYATYGAPNGVDWFPDLPDSYIGTIWCPGF